VTIQQIETFNPTGPVGNNGTIQIPVTSTCGTIYLINESIATVVLSVDGNVGAIIGILPANWAQPFLIPFKVQALTWTVIANQNVIDTSIQQIQGAAYDSNEDISKLYAGPLPRQFNVGNVGGVNTNVTSTSELLNQGNPQGTQIALISVTGVGNVVTWTNDGLFFMGIIDAGNVLHTIFQTSKTAPQLTIGQASDTISIPSFVRDIGGIAGGAGADLALSADGGHSIDLQTGGVTWATLNSGQISATATPFDMGKAASTSRIRGSVTVDGTVSFQAGSLTHIAKQGGVALNVGTTAYNHNLGWVPDYLVIEATTASSSATTGWDSPALNTINITVGATLHYDLLFFKFT
jgi:hypothetical protein